MKLDINNYPGSKSASGVIQRILNNIPEHDIFVDMCAGSGAVGFAALKLLESTVIMCEKYQPVFQQLEQKKQELPMLPGRLYLKHIDSIDFYFDRMIDGNTFERTIFYIDPPYLKMTRRSSRNLYGVEWNENDHLYMLNLVNRLKEKTGSDIMINHYDCDLYRDQLKGWFTEEYTTMTRGGATKDKLWMSYDITKRKLATTSFLGKNFSDRQRIKRRKESFLKKLKNMPLHERQAILEHINKNL